MSVDMVNNQHQRKQSIKKIAGEPTDPLTRMIALGGLVPVCVHCKRIRDDKGGWKKVKGFDINRCSFAVSHFICPECAKKLYPEFYKGNT